MKDALGHGSNPRGAHQQGVAAVGEGFTLRAYHGTTKNYDGLPEARQSALGAKGVYLATNPEHANAFARDNIDGTGRIIPVLVRGKIAPRDYVLPLYGLGIDKMVERLKSEGYAGFYEDREHSGFVVFDSANIKSRFAKG